MSLFELCKAEVVEVVLDLPRARIEDDKALIKRVEELIKKIRECRAPPMSGWDRCVKALDDYKTTTKRIATIAENGWSRKAIQGWSQLVDALCALYACTVEDRHKEACERILEKAKADNDELQNRMWVREKESAMLRGLPQPTLESAIRKDISSEVRYKQYESYFDKHDLNLLVKGILEHMETAITTGGKSIDVARLIQKLPLPSWCAIAEPKKEEEDDGWLG